MSKFVVNLGVLLGIKVLQNTFLLGNGIFTFLQLDYVITQRWKVILCIRSENGLKWIYWFSFRIKSAFWSCTPCHVLLEASYFCISLTKFSSLPSLLLPDCARCWFGFLNLKACLFPKSWTNVNAANTIILYFWVSLRLMKIVFVTTVCKFPNKTLVKAENCLFSWTIWQLHWPIADSSAFNFTLARAVDLGDYWVSGGLQIEATEQTFPCTGAATKNAEEA